MNKQATLIAGIAVALLGGVGLAHPQAQVSAFLENHERPGLGSVALFNEVTGTLTSRPAELQNIRLLEFEFTGRTPLTEVDPSVPHLHVDLPGAARVSLPFDLGCLYRYERPEGHASAYGFLYIDGQGGYRTLAEVLVPRWLGSSDPFMRRIAFSPDAMSFLVATRLRAGGNLLEVELSTGRVLDRTALIGPKRFKPRGLALGSSWGMAITRTGVLRFERGKKSYAQSVAFPAPGPAFFANTVAQSQNTDWAVIAAGTSGSSTHVFAIGATGNAVRVSDQPARISVGGFLPQDRNGPYLAVSDDGRLAAWRQEMTDLEGFPTTELFLARVPIALPTPAEQLSSDARYLDTLDEVGQIFFLDPRTLAYTVGEKEVGLDGLGTSGADLFTARMGPGLGGPQILNLSQTNGQASAPFTLRPAMKPGRMAWLASERRFLIFDDGEAEAIVSVDATLGGLQVVMDEVKAVGLFELTSSGLLFDARRTNVAGGNWELSSQTGGVASPPVLVESSSTDNDNGRSMPRADGLVSFVGSPGGTARLSRVNVMTGALETMQGYVQFGPTIGYSPNGSLAFSGINGASQTEFGLWNSDGSLTMLSTPPGATGFVLASR